MTLIRNLFFLFTITIFALASLVLDIFNYNPYESGRGVFINFFTSLCLSLTGIIAFIIYFMKLKLGKEKNINSYFFPSIRQGFLVSLGITLLLILRSLQILDWWVAGPMVIAVILLELFFQTSSPIKKHKKNKNQI